MYDALPGIIDHDFSEPDKKTTVKVDSRFYLLILSKKVPLGGTFLAVYCTGANSILHKSITRHNIECICNRFMIYVSKNTKKKCFVE